MRLVFGEKKKVFRIECIFCGRKYFLWMCTTQRVFTRTSLDLRQSVWALFWYTVFVSLFSHWCHIRNKPSTTCSGSQHGACGGHSQQPFWAYNSWQTGGRGQCFLLYCGVFLLHDFCVLRCLISACSPGNFSSLCTNYKCKWSQETAVCGLLTKWLLTDALFSVWVVTKAGFTLNDMWHWGVLTERFTPAK